MCVRECAGDRHVSEGSGRCECKNYLDVDRRTCVSRCDYWRWVGTERWCELWCPTELPVADDDGECTICAAIDEQKRYFVRGRNKCYPSCADTGDHPFSLPGDVECLTACPSTTPYHFGGECFARCPFRSYRRAGSMVCEEAPDAVSAEHYIVLGDERYDYFLRRA